MAAEIVVVVAVGLFAALWFGAAGWARAAKRRDAERAGRWHRPARPGRRPPARR